MAANAEKEKLELQRLVLEHVLQRMVKVRDDYNVQLQELYFLQTGGNMMDFMAWKQRPNKHLEEFMAQNRLDEDDVPSLPSSGGATVDQTGRKREENAAKEDQNLPSVSDGDRIATGGVSAGFQAGDGLRKAQPVASAPSSQEQIAMQAKQEATVLKRVSELTNEGLWSSKRLPKVHEPARKKTHWDYLLEEMHWLATDFAQERRWKKAAARKLATSVAKLHAQRLQKEQRAEREEVTRLKRVASLVAKEIRQYWTNIEKIVQYKQDHRLAEKRQKALDMHLNFIVGQTEKYSSWLMESMSEPVGTGTASSSRCLSRELSVRGSGSELDKSDLSSESDDEATIEKEEAAPSEDILAHDAELKLLEQEATLDLDQLKSSLPSEIFSEPAKPVFRDSSDESSSEEEAEGEEECDQQKDAMDIDCQSQTEKDVSGPRTRSRSLPLDGTSAPEKDSADDKEFTVTDEMEAGEGRDDEETMEKEEKHEGTVDHNRELADLKEEGDMPIEELLKMYGQTGPASETTSAEASSLPETEEEKESDDSNDDESPEQKDGIEQLVSKPDSSDSVKGPEELNSVAAAAEQLQPTGITLDSTTVKTPVPFLLKHKLREYQHIGLDWLVTMHDKTLNGILADEMGLGKTMQTIALLAHLACDRGIWGPHLIVVPTSVVLNWEMEIKKWCPAFKILTYWGSIKERKLKRQGWTKHNTFHICITSYKLVVQDNHIFRRKKWKYFILDEAHNIKNFKSQRWQVLLNFNSQRRLLLTGTPLQNSLMELWSLMHFLMPHVFTSHQEFREWFSNPLTGMIEGSREYNESLVKRLHKVLRPFLLRRLKSEVEKQLPNKYEHVIGCRLSKRQRFLYDDFMDRTKTKETLASGNFLSVINILMQLRKVCNHPDLFETRPIVSPLVMQGITFYTASLIVSALDKDPFDIIDLPYLNVSLVDFELSMDAFAAQRTHGLQTPKKLIVELSSPESTPAGVTPSHPPSGLSNDSALPESPGIPISAYDGEDMAMFNHLASHSSRQYSTRAAAVVSSQVGESMLQSLIIPGVVERRAMTVESRQDYIHRINTRRCSRRPLYGLDTRSTLDVNKHDRGDDPFDFDSSTLGHWSWQARSHHACSLTQRTELTSRQLYWLCTDLLQQAICTPCERAQQLEEILKRFIMWIPNVENPPIVMHASHTPPSMIREQALYHTMLDKELSTLPPLLHPVTTAMKLQFPETRLIQYDCGKLQTLDRLLRQLKVDSHRVLIFTQMTRMLDILEAFLNYHGHTYFRLDGATRIDRRQQLMDHFNMDKRIFCFILSTRSGGIGVNLTGADTVIFYDSDWNPTMDAQAQDRCHRIGQTRDVSIYRLISEHTVEENILKKAKQKKLLGDLAIEGGSFTTEFFKQRDIRDIFDLEGEAKGDSNMEAMSEVADMTQKQLEETLAGAEDEQDVLAANQATAEQVAELAEFSETAIDDPQGESRAGVSEAEPELSQTEQKLAHLQKQLTPVERRCVHLVEDAMSEYMDWQLKAAENQVEHDKKNWELSHLQALKQAEELKAEEEDELMLTFAQEDIQDKVKRKRKRRRSITDDEISPVESPVLKDSVVETDFDGLTDTSTPRLPSRRRKTTRYLEDFDCNPGDDSEVTTEGMRIRPRSSQRTQVSSGGFDSSGSPKTSTRKSTKGRVSSNRTPVTVAHNPNTQLPSQLTGGVVMAPLVMQTALRGLSPSPITTIPLNCPVTVAGLRPIAPSPVGNSTICSTSGGPYMLVTVGPDGQSISRKVVTLPPNVVFRVVPMSVGTTIPTNQTSQSR